jgi:hypothetical protein
MSMLNDRAMPTKIFDFINFAVFLHSKLLRAHTLITHNWYFFNSIHNKIRQKTNWVFSISKHCFYVRHSAVERHACSRTFGYC